MLHPAHLQSSGRNEAHGDEGLPCPDTACNLQHQEAPLAVSALLLLLALPTRPQEACPHRGSREPTVSKNSLFNSDGEA